MNYRPTQNYIVADVGDSEPEVTPFGIILPIPKEEPRQSIGTVIAVGPGRRHKKTGKLIPTTVRVGDRVAFSKYGHTKIGTLRVFHEESVHYVCDP